MALDKLKELGYKPRKKPEFEKKEIERVSYDFGLNTFLNQ